MSPVSLVTLACHSHEQPLTEKISSIYSSYLQKTVRQKTAARIPNVS